jgi:hypothetical protein
MLFLPLILGLAASVNAIDLYLGWRGGSNYVACRNINPNVCCSTAAGGSPFNSLDFREIPRNWNIQCRGHRGPQCGSLAEVKQSNGATAVSLFNSDFGGSGYGFVSKRSTDDAVVETVRPSLLVFGDGAQYDLSELTESSYDEMVCASYVP